MPHSATCPVCQATLDVPESLEGDTFTCAMCNSPVPRTAPVRARAKPAPAKGKKGKPEVRTTFRTRPDGDEPRDRDEDDDRPRKKAKKAGPPVFLIASGLALCAAVMLGVVGLVGWVLLGGGPPDAKPVAVAGPPAAFDAGPVPIAALPIKPLPDRAPVVVNVPAAKDTKPEKQAAAPPPADVPAAAGGGVPGLPVGPMPAAPRAAPPPVVPEVPLAKFDEAANPYAVGSQTNVKPGRTIPAPGNAVDIRYSAKHQLLFGRNGATGVWVIDAATGKSLGMQTAKNSFMDLSLSPSQDVLFVTDFGGEHIGYGTPLKPHFVHKYDLKKRAWAVAQAPKVAGRVEAVDDNRLLLLERDQWVAVSLNTFAADGVTEHSRLGCGYNGDIEYDPRTGRIFHGSIGISSNELSLRKIVGNKIEQVASSGTYGGVHNAGGRGQVVLSADGARLYYGTIAVESADVTHVVAKFPEAIFAASRDLAFGTDAYYSAADGTKLGTLLPVDPKKKPREAYSRDPGPPMAVSPDQKSLWLFDSAKNQYREFLLTGVTDGK